MEARAKEKEEETTKDKEYIILLEARLADTASKGMALESRVTLTNQRLELVDDAIKKAKEGAEVTKTKAQAAQMEVASIIIRAIKKYKGSEDFKNEVGETTYDTFLKGFAECKIKVLEAFPDLDLKDIVVEETEEEEEEKAKAKIAEGVLVMRTKEVEEVKAIGSLRRLKPWSQRELRSPRSAETRAEEIAMTARVAAFAGAQIVAAIQETVAKMMAKIEPIINVTVEAFKSNTILASYTSK